MDNAASKISQFFSKKSVFITGGTGFIGKVLIEKLLRSCPDLENIYILIRPKKGRSEVERLQDILQSPLFERLHLKYPAARHKIIPLPGDMTCSELGLSQENQEIIKKHVSVVFHSAATIKFDEPLKNAIIMNVLGTKRLIELCYKMEKLQAFIHVSTAYSNCYLTEIAEKVYEPSIDISSLIKYAESDDEDDSKILPPGIIQNHPNSYTYTKFLAEKLVDDHSQCLPVAIVRPSIVTASWNESIPGWIDNINGPTGLIVGVVKGFIRTIWCYEDYIFDFMPVDTVINILISAAWFIATTRPDHTMVFNATSGSMNPTRWKDLVDIMYPVSLDNPVDNILWYPKVRLTRNRMLNKLYAFFFHTVTAYAGDLVLKVQGKKPYLVHILKKFSSALSTLEYFTTHQWHFHIDNVLELYGKLNSADKIIFNFSVSEIDWRSYFHDYFLGIRKFVLHETEYSSNSARQHLRRLYWAHRVSQVLMVLLLVKIFTNCLPLVQRMCEIIISCILSSFKSFLSLINFSKKIK